MAGNLFYNGPMKDECLCCSTVVHNGIAQQKPWCETCTKQVYQGNITFFFSHDQIFPVCYIRANLYMYETKAANWILYEVHRYRQCMHSTTSSKLK